MKQIQVLKILVAFLTPFLFFAGAAQAQAPELTARAIAEIVREVNQTQFQFRERGSLHGYVDAKSCLWVSARLIIVEHYCGSSNIPARALSLWSPDFGILYIYEEDLGRQVRRDLVIDSFPENLAPYLISDLRKYSVAIMNSALEKMERQGDPGCWSTNYDLYTDGPSTGCYGADIQRFSAWADETQAIVNSVRDWNTLFSTILAKIRR